MEVRRFIIAYDVVDDARRARVAALLSQHGVRIQLSVFDCEVGTGDADSLLDHVKALIDTNVDSVVALHQCDDCDKNRINLGQAPVGLGVGWWVI